LAPILAGETITRRDWGVIALTLAGAFAVSYPNLSHWLLGDLWGLASGVVAGWAIVSLRVLRQTDHTLTILAFVFVFGSIFFLPIYTVVARPASSESFFYIALTAATGSAGQLLLTYGFRYVRAVEGSIISSSRILIALLAGYLVLEEAEGWYTAMGALLLLIAHIGNATRGYYKAKKKAR
jgi:drug/metabolite transporter (DMT)-like permease